METGPAQRGSDTHARPEVPRQGGGLGNGEVCSLSGQTSRGPGARKNLARWRTERQGVGQRGRKSVSWGPEALWSQEPWSPGEGFGLLPKGNGKHLEVSKKGRDTIRFAFLRGCPTPQQRGEWKGHQWTAWVVGAGGREIKEVWGLPCGITAVGIERSGWIPGILCR